MKNICKAEYKNTTILLNELEYDNNKFYYIQITKNYNKINCNILKTLEYNNYNDAITVYKNFLTIIDIL